MTTLIQVEDLVKEYTLGGVPLHALDHVNVSIDKGELVAIMGASGSGKSTLMNVLGCLDRPTSGRYVLAGREVSQLSRGELADVRNKTIGFVFQSFNLLARTSARENVELPLVYAGLSRKERVRRSAAALERVGLGNRIDHTPAQLSGGHSSASPSREPSSTTPVSSSRTNPRGTLIRRRATRSWRYFRSFGKTGSRLSS
jgi:putative ABC transport system ATP-binding protein